MAVKPLMLDEEKWRDIFASRQSERILTGILSAVEKHKLNDKQVDCGVVFYKELVDATDRLLKKAVSSTMIRQDGEIYYLGSKPDYRMIKALEVLVHFRKRVNWHVRGDFPYQISFYMNDKVFDVAVIEEGEEAI